MGRNTKTSIILALCAILLLSVIPFAASQTALSSDFNAQYGLPNQNQKLFISIQPSLYNYYSNLTHRIVYDSDYAKQVTPSAVQSIADNLWKLVQNQSYSDEQFANLVLGVVHQIPYNITGARYPVETLRDNRGDCGALSLLAASIMKAGGLDVVLIKYTGIDPPHMNVGVHLENAPVYHSIWLSPTGLDYNNQTYWTAEATPQAQWQIGDQSYSLGNAMLSIIPLDKCPQTSPGQVSSNLDEAPLPAKVIINVSQSPANISGQRTLLISGLTQPSIPNSSISLFIKGNGSYNNYSQTTTNDLGAFAYVWNLTKDGTYYVTATSEGNGTYAGADSETLLVFIGPPSLLQFQTDTYSYIIGVPFGDVAIRPFVGIDNFLEIPLGTNLTLRYNFQVLQTGSQDSPFNPVNVTVPNYRYSTTGRNRQPQMFELPSTIRTVPTYIPRGMTQLALPKDFNQTINSNFCMVIQRDSNGSYSLRVKGLDGYDVSNLQSNKTNAVLNATQGIAENTWYEVSTVISASGIKTDLQQENGAAQSNLSAVNKSQLVLLLANNVDSAVVLRDFKIQAIGATTPDPTTSDPTPSPSGSTVPAIVYELAVIALICAIAVLYVKIKKLDH